MDSAKKSVEKILEIAKKHGYACVVGFAKLTNDVQDAYTGIVGDKKTLQVFTDTDLIPKIDKYLGDNETDK